MSLDDIGQVMVVEKESFPTMWPQTAFKHELQQNRMARYLVVVKDELQPDREPWRPPELRVMEPDREPGAVGRFLGELRQRLGGSAESGNPPPAERPKLIIGFVGVWLLPDDAHIVTVAVRESYRRQGIGELLVITAIELAQETQHPRVSLECRVSNSPALALYGKYLFQQVGLRARYYSDNHEDAYVLSVRSVTTPDYRDYFQRMKANHRRRLGDQAPDR